MDKTSKPGKVAATATLGTTAAAVVLLALALLAPAGGCGSAEDEGFAIYLLAEETPPAQLPALSHIEIADTPLISSNDVISYSRDTHEMELMPAAYFRIHDLDVPLTGRAFAVCVDHHPVYAGAFMTPIWSGVFDGVIILKPFDAQLSLDRYVLRIDLGYPSPEFFRGQDPRADPAILDALEQAGKLE